MFTDYITSCFCYLSLWLLIILHHVFVTYLYHYWLYYIVFLLRISIITDYITSCFCYVSLWLLIILHHVFVTYIYDYWLYYIMFLLLTCISIITDDMIMHMTLFRVRDGFISAQISEIFHEPLGEWKIGDECWDNPSRTRNNAICILSHDFRCFVHF